MGLSQLFEPITNLFKERARRTWVSDSRAHIEFRLVEGDELRAFSELVRSEAVQRPTIRWVQVNAYTRRVVFEFVPNTLTVSELVRIVEGSERASRIDAARFSQDEREHPADLEPGLREAVELAADIAAFFVGTASRLSPFPPMPLAGNLSAVLALVRSTAGLRRGIEERLGRERADLVLNLAASAVTALAQRPMVSLVDGVHKGAIFRENQARRRAWEKREPGLCASSAEGLVGDSPAEARPYELPRGPIEEYADRAWFVALAGFGVSFATTRSVQRAAAALYGSMPRPARLGREVFCAELGRVLASREALLLDPTVLRRLDRIDCLVLQGDLVSKQRFEISRLMTAEGVEPEAAHGQVDRLFNADEPLSVQAKDGWELGPWRLLDAVTDAALEEHSRTLARSGALVLGLVRDGRMVGVVEVEVVSQIGIEEIISLAHQAQMRVVIASNDDSVLQSINADDVIPDGDGIRAGIRRLQREGRGVCLVTRGPSPGLPVADCGLGMHAEGSPAPWGADIICRDDLADVRFILRACSQARNVSKQSVNVALAAATVGALVSAGGLLRLTGRRVLFVVNSATLFAMMNGVRNTGALRRRELPSPRDLTPWHALDAEGVLERIGSSRYGLAPREAEERLRPLARPPSAARELGEAITEELFNPLAPLLAAGAGLSAAVGSLADAGMVGSVVVLNALVGGAQRFRTDRKIRDLSRKQKRRALVRRDAKLKLVDADELVGGDVVLLGAGDVVPADCRIVEASSLEVDASSQTGESLPVKKSAMPSFAVQIADRSSMLYEGTTVAAGQATAVVVATGDQTEARRGAAAAKGSRTQGGVEKRLRSLMGLTAPIALGAGAGVVGVGLLRGRKLEDLVGSGVSLAVASVPEGLPLLATAAQLSAAERLSHRKALVRNVRSIEALGRVDIICLDKTGTVTEGRLALSLVSDGEVAEAVSELRPERLRVLACGLRATIGGKELAIRGDPTDDALREGAAAVAVDTGYGCHGWQRRADLSLEVGRSYHAVLGRADDGTLLYVKGAPEALLLQCTHYQRADGAEPLSDETRLRLISEATRLARRGLRVLAVAERAVAADAQLAPEQVVDLTFRGFVAFSDPVRATAAQAIDGLRRAGVQTLMITGDHPSTAESIASELDLLRGKSIVTGAELASLSDEQLDRRIADIAVFARVTPSQKVRVVRALQRAGRVVAMAGDGANDAAAIRLSDVGIAVGETSTAAARGAADVVLTDGRIETLVDAIVEGRAMWASVRDAVSILMGGNLGEIGFTLGAGLIDGRPPLHARQLLLVNLLTDVAPAMAIALKPPSPRTFESLATETPDAALGEPLNRDIATRAVVTTIGAGSAWAIGRFTGSRARARTVGLAALVGTQLGQTLSSGGFSRPVVLTSLASWAFLGTIIQTPGVSHLFGCRPLGPLGWTTAIGASVVATRLSPRVAKWLDPIGTGSIAVDSTEKLSGPAVSELLIAEQGMEES